MTAQELDTTLHTGSAVVDALLADKTFTPRAVTRNASSEAAKHLASRGVEVVVADLWDKESIKHALAGSEGVFGVSNAFFDILCSSDDVTRSGHKLLRPQYRRSPG